MKRTKQIPGVRTKIALWAIAALCGGVGLTAHSQSVTNPPPKSHWENVASADLTLTRGNSENFMATVSLNSKAKWDKDELLLGAGAGYGETKTETPTGGKETTKTADYLRGFGQWNHLFSPRLYGGLRIDGLHDDIADVNYRFTFSPLAGYYVVKEPNTLLGVEIGPSYVYEQVAGDTDGYFALRIAERFEHKFKAGAKVWETVEWIPQVDDFENWIMNAEVGASAPITKSLDIRLVFQDTYDNQPAPGREKNDLKLMAGLGYRF